MSSKNLIQIKRGVSNPKADQLKQGELGYNIATETLFVGNGDKEPTEIAKTAMFNGLKFGGRNLVLNSAVVHESASHEMASYWLSPFASEEVGINGHPLLKDGDDYTLSFKAKIVAPTIGTKPTTIQLYWGNSQLIGTLNTVAWNESHVYEYSFKADQATNDKLRICLGPNTSNYGNSTIYWVKIEQGRYASDWTVAPEDLEVQLNETVVSTVVEYYLSDSQTSLQGGTWTTTAPQWTNNKYMWSRTKVTYRVGEPVYTPSKDGVCIAGAIGPSGPSGADGLSGRGVESIVEQYNKTSNKQTPAEDDVGWQNDPYQWTPGYYLWTRHRITYNNPASIEYTSPVFANEWEAIDAIKIGGRNLRYNLYSTESEDDIEIDPIAETATIIIGNELAEDREYAVPQEYDLDRESVNNLILCLVGDIFEGHIDELISISFDCKINEDGVVRPLTLFPYQNNGFTIPLSYTFMPQLEWQRFLFEGIPIVALDSGNRQHSPGELGIQDNQGNNSFTIRQIQIEFGNKATNWTPALEDIDRQNQQVLLAASEAQNIAGAAQDAVQAVETIAAEAQTTAATAGTKATHAQATAKGAQDQLKPIINNIQVVEPSTPGDPNAKKSIVIDTAQATILLQSGANRIQITGDKISFQSDNNEATYIKEDTLLVENQYITNQYPRVLTETGWVGELAWVARSNGHLSLKKVQGGIK